MAASDRGAVGAAVEGVIFLKEGCYFFLFFCSSPCLFFGGGVRGERELEVEEGREREREMARTRGRKKLRGKRVFFFSVVE